MGFRYNGDDPTARRRVDPETQRNRDAEVAWMRRANVPFRVIGERLGMSLGAVQKATRRAQKVADAMATGEPGNVVAALEDGLTADDVRTSADVERLGGLERYRLRHMDGEQGRAERARVVAEREARRQRFAAEHVAEIAAIGFVRAYDDTTGRTSTTGDRFVLGQHGLDVNRGGTTPAVKAARSADTHAESHNRHAPTWHIGGIRPQTPGPEARRSARPAGRTAPVITPMLAGKR